MWLDHLLSIEKGFQTVNALLASFPLSLFSKIVFYFKIRGL